MIITSKILNKTYLVKFKHNKIQVKGKKCIIKKEYEKDSDGKYMRNEIGKKIRKVNSDGKEMYTKLPYEIIETICLIKEKNEDPTVQGMGFVKQDIHDTPNQPRGNAYAFNKALDDFCKGENLKEKSYLVKKEFVEQLSIAKRTYNEYKNLNKI